MGFIENISKLVVSNGTQYKINDKDKAILAIVDKIVNGGGGQTTKTITSCYLGQGNNYTRIPITDGAISLQATNGVFYFVTDELPPDVQDLSNVSFVIVYNEIGKTVKSINTISTLKVDGNIDVYNSLENLNFSNPYLTINFSN